MADARHRIFISYSRADSDFVDRLEGDLQARNFGTWVDRLQLEGGQTWVDEIQHAIDRSDILLVVVTPDSMASPWVQKEYVYALGERKHVLPVLLRSVPKQPVALSNIQNISFVSDYDAGLKSLLLALTTIEFIPPPPVRDIQRAPITSDPSDLDGFEDLVVVHPPLPQPPPDLTAYYDAGYEARANHDLDRAAILWQQVYDQDPDFSSGFLKQQLAKLNDDLKPTREKRARDRALEAMAKGEWRQASGAWQALLGLNPDSTLAAEAQTGIQNALRGRAKTAHQQGAWGEELGAWEALLRLAPKDAEAKDRIPIAQHNQEGDLLYARATNFVERNSPEPAREVLRDLWQFCPYYGDPKGIAARIGEKVPPSYEEVKAAEAAAKVAADRKAAEAKAEADRNAAAAAALRKKQLADVQAEAKRKEDEAQRKAEQDAAAARAAEQMAQKKRAATYRRPYFIEKQLGAKLEILLIWPYCLLFGIGVTAGLTAHSFGLFSRIQVAGVALVWPASMAVVTGASLLAGALVLLWLGYYRAVQYRALLLAALICVPVSFALVWWMPTIGTFHLHDVFASYFHIHNSTVEGFGSIGSFTASQAFAIGYLGILLGGIAGIYFGIVLGSKWGAGGILLGLLLGIPIGMGVGFLTGLIVGGLFALIVGLPLLFLGFMSGALVLGLVWGTLGGLAIGPSGGDGEGVSIIFGYAVVVPIVVGVVGYIVGIFGADAMGWLILATIIGTIAGVGLGTSIRVWWQAWFSKRPSVDELLAFGNKSANNAKTA